MQKRILYINYMLQYGHINFDLIHINALKNQGHDVKVIAHETVAQRMSLSKETFLFTIPDMFDLNTQSGILNRIMYVLTLIFIRIRICAKNYDHIIISNVEEVSLCVMPPAENMIIFAHALNASLKSKAKLLFIRTLARKNKFVVFNEHMKIPFTEAGITNVGVISHGCMPPFSYDISTPVPFGIEQGQKIIFHPSDRPNPRFVNELLNEDSIHKLLDETDSIMIIRDRSGSNKSKGRIKIISDYLPKEVYQNVFLKADIILLAYPEDFLYKVSGVSYESLANRKRMLILNNPSFFYCKDYFNYDPLFNSVAELKNKIAMLFTNLECSCTADSSVISPDYSSILN